MKVLVPFPLIELLDGFDNMDVTQRQSLAAQAN